MNELIRKLAQQSGLEWTIRSDYDAQNLEKFAELIIAECLDSCEEFEIEVNRGTLVSRIKRRFNINE